MKAQRKKKSARERGYQPIEEVAAGLRSLAAQLVQDNKGRLAKVTLNVWYEDDDEPKLLTELRRAMIEHDDDIARLDRNTQSAAGGSSD
jgi:hypothetical protein